MRLNAPGTLLAIMGVQEGAGALASAQAALDAVTPVLETMLGTSFARREITDYFNMGVLSSRLSTYYPKKLLLSQAILAEDEAVVVRYSPTNEALSATVIGEIYADSEYAIDRKTGLIELSDAPAIGRKVISVTYTAGFSETGGAYDEEQVPDWLKSISLTAATYVMNSHPSTPANRKAALVATVTEQLRGYLSSLTRPHFRPRYDLEFPVSSTAL